MLLYRRLSYFLPTLFPLTKTYQKMHNRRKPFPCLSHAAFFLCLFLTLAQSFFLTAIAKAQEAASTATETSLQLVGTYPLEGEAFQDRLVLFFNEPLASWEDPEDAEPEPPLSFEPPLQGTFEVKENYISFSRSDFSPENYQVITVRPSPKLRAESGRSLPSNECVLHYSTFALTIDSSIIASETEENWQVFFSFPIAMDFPKLKSGMRVEDANKASIDAALSQTEWPKIYQITLPKNRPWPFTMRFEAGIPEEEGRIRTHYPLEYTFPKTTPLYLCKAKMDFDAENQLTLSFSGDVDATRLEKSLTLREKESGKVLKCINHQVNDEGKQHSLGFDIPLNTTIEVLIGKELLDNEFHALEKDFSYTSDPQVKPLQIKYHWWEDETLDKLTLHLRLNDKVEEEAFKNAFQINPAVEDLEVTPAGSRDFEITGSFSCEQSYEIVLKKGLTSTDKKRTVVADSQYSLDETPKLRGASFKYDGKIYFPQRAAGKMEIQTRNLEEVSIRLHKLLPSNLVTAMRRLENGQVTNSFNRLLTQQLDEVTLPITQTQEEVTTLPVDFSQMLPADKKGIFALTLSPSFDWRSTKVLLWTNMALLAHWQDDEAVVLVHDLYSLEPIAGAEVTLYSYKNQALGVANTDKQGIARFRALDTSLGEPYVVVAETKTDAAFLKLARQADNVTAWDSVQEPYGAERYDAFIYSDRDLYRPGETVHARWIVRTHYGDAAGNMPVEMQLLNPKGHKVQTEVSMLSELGTAGLDIDSQASWLTGRYTLQLWIPGEKTAFATYRFQIEEFVPNRIKATVDTDAPYFTKDATHTITVQADHLFGTPAADRTCEINVLLQAVPYQSKKWPGFRFANEDSFETDLQSLGEQVTDKTGRATFEYTFSPTQQATQPLQALLRGEVREVGGRPVSHSKKITLFPDDVLLGVAAMQGKDAQTLDVRAAAIRPDDSPAPLETVQVTLEKETWRYYVRRYDGYNKPNWTREYTTIETRTIPLQKGEGNTSFLLGDYGQYRVRVHTPETRQYASLNVYRYYDEVNVVANARPSLLNLSLNQDSYQPGEEVVLHIESPFDGKGLVVVQGEHFHQVYPVTIRKNMGEVRFFARETLYPNVFLETTVIHTVDHTKKAVHPYSSFETINVPIKDPKRKVTVTFEEIPEEMRPAQNLSCAITTRNHVGEPVAAEVTVAAVDEGILSILGYKTPDPYPFFQRPRRPEHNRAHYYDKVAYDFDTAAIGGDGELLKQRLGKDTPVVDENWIKPLALWSGVVHTDEHGHADVNFSVPEFNGTLRLVAVAVTQQASGSKSSPLLVRRPYILRTSAPRFALPGDRFECNATVFNTTTQPCRAKIHWQAQAALQGEGSSTKTIAPGQEISLWAPIHALDETGQGHILWTVEIQEEKTDACIEKLQETMPLPVRTPAAYQSHHELLILEPGEERTLQNTRFIENAQHQSQISVGANPLLRLTDSLNFLVQYPYGCLEQTVSRCMPLYLVRKTTALLEATLLESRRAKQCIEAGIERLISMRTPSGGLGFWPGGNEPYPYGSVYACHFLTLVKQEREFTVPAEAFKALQTYVRHIARTQDDGSASGQYLRAYALYVLALDGRLEAIENISVYDTVAIPPAARYLLAAALAINTQDQQRVRQYLDSTPTQIYNVQETYGTLNSPIRNTAVELLARLQMKEDLEQLHEPMTQLIRFLEGEHHTTQDTAFVATALAQYFNTIEKNLAQAAAIIITPTGEYSLTSSETFHDTHEGPDGHYTVKNTGQVPLFINFITAGLPKNPQRMDEENGVSVRRILRSTNGAQVAENTFEQGASYLVELQINSVNELKHLVIADILPAGFEIQNPRLDPDALTGLDMKKTLFPTYHEIRDDRLVVVFENVPDKKRNFYYLVRAVTPGQFQQPGLAAECMYAPAVNAKTAASQIEIKHVR